MPDPVPIPNLPALHEAVAKGVKLLEALAEPHEQPDGEDHAWRTCRRCLALEEGETEHARQLFRALLDELERLQSLWDAEHATVMRLLSERDATREQRDAFAVEMKDEACAAVDKVTASACDKIDALNQRHAEIVSVVADISKAYAADKKRHAEAVERAYREALG